MGGGGASMGGSGSNMGSSMGRSNSEGGARGNAPMGNSAVGSGGASHSSPTTLLSDNPQLASTLQGRLGSMLPSGTSLTEAASGFKNLGQFIAAVHVSHNLGIPFEGLKTKMANGDNLGKAIKELKPSANSKSEVKKANRQANEDLRESKQ